MGGLLSGGRGHAADGHLEEINNKLKAVAAYSREQGSGSWVPSCIFSGLVCIFLESSEYKYISRLLQTLYRSTSASILTLKCWWSCEQKLFMCLFVEGNSFIIVQFRIAQCNKWAPTSDICWLSSVLHWMSFEMPFLISSDPEEVLHWDPGSWALKYLCRR